MVADRVSRLRPRFWGVDGMEQQFVRRAHFLAIIANNRLGRSAVKLNSDRTLRKSAANIARIRPPLIRRRILRLQILQRHVGWGLGPDSTDSSRLYSAPFQSRRQEAKDRCRNHPARWGKLKGIPHPVAQDCELSIPLERLRLEIHRLALCPQVALPWQISKAAAPLRFLFCPLRAHFPYAGGQPKRSVSLTALEIHKRAGNPDYARPSCFMPAPGPGMKPASRAAPR